MSAAENKAVFLSYASQDAGAAKRIADALRAAGVEVWFDVEGGLEHGDEWDAKIRRQIKECVLFIAVISANTQAREEGYFRIEWDLAAERARGIASGVAFILPVIIDDTKEPAVLVPDRFRAVQWTRLRDGNVPPEVLQRFLKLWSHRTGALKQAASDPTHAELGSAKVSPAPKRRFVWLVPLVIALLAVAGLVLWRASLKPAATLAVAPPSEARQLATKARALLAAGRVVSRETLAAADDLAAQALKLDPTDAEVLATSAQVDAFMVYRGFDISEGRRQSAAKRSQRALALAPGSFEARHARAVVAGFLAVSPEMLAESERIYRELWQERPADDVLGQELGRVLQDENHFADAAAVFLRAKQPLDAGWAYFLDGQFQEADKVADRLLAEKRDVLTFVLKANVALFGFGDLTAAQAAVGQLTPTELLNDDAAGIALRLALVQRDAPRILQLLGAFANPFVSIGGVNYPRQYWTGHAQQMLAHPEAARSEWRGALRALEERLKSNSADAESLGWVAVLQAMLGEKEAAQTLRLYLNYNPVPPGRWDWWQGLTLLHLGGRNDEVLDRLAGELHRPHGQRTLYLFARSCPEFDPLRADPRLETLLRETLPAGMKPFTATTDQTAGAKVDDKSVAVLAFADNSPGRDSEYFSDGISEELINALGKVPGLKVPARTSSFYFKGKSVPVSEIAKQLGVAYVIEGSVQRAGEKVKISARLSKAADGFQVWTESFLREAKDVFAVEEEIAGLIAKQLSLKLGASSSAVTASVNPEAFELYVRGRQAWNLRTDEGFSRAEVLLTKAIEIEPNFARAHAAIADVWSLRGQVDNSLTAFGLRDGAIADRVVAKCELALRLDPRSAEAQASLGALYWDIWRFADSERELRQAIRLNDNYASAHQWLGRTLMMEGRLDDALVALKRATELDPLSPRILDNYAWALVFAGRFSEAIAFCDRALALQSTATQALALKAIAFAEMGRSSKATELARALPTNDSRYSMFRVVALGRAGSSAEVESSLGVFEKGSTISKVAGLAALKRYDDAFAAFDPAWIVSSRADFLLFHPVFDPMRDDPRFQKNLADLGLTEAHARAQAWRKAHPPERVELK